MKKRESETLEFKKSTSELKEAVIALGSMLNKHQRGLLYFGVKNDGSVVGQQIGASTTSDISKAIRNHLKPRIIPEIEVVKEEEKDVIRVEVRGEDTPYSTYGRYYIRSDDEDIVMTNAQLESFFINKNYDYSKWEKQSTEYTADDVDEDLLIRYVNEGNESGRINFLFKDVKTTLNKLELLNGDYLNNAGYYLFSNKRPLLLKLATYPTDERISFSDMKQFRGNILECIDEAIKYVTNNIRWHAEIRGTTRVEIPEVPLEAFREIIVNSFAHMKINPASSNEIYITPTRIHIYNPGPLVPGTDPKMFASGEQGSMIRNPLIATALYYNKTIDAFGTGFERVFRICRNIGYSYRSNQFGFTFEFIRPNNDTINDMINEPLTTDEGHVLDLLRKNRRKYTKADMANAIGKSISTVNRVIKSLTDKDLIERIGSKKTGYWKAKE